MYFLSWQRQWANKKQEEDMNGHHGKWGVHLQMGEKREKSEGYRGRFVMLFYYVCSSKRLFYICMQYILLTLPIPSLCSIPCLSLFSLTVPFLDWQLVGWFSNTLSPIRVSIGPLIGTIHWSLWGQQSVLNSLALLTQYIHILKEC